MAQPDDGPMTDEELVAYVDRQVQNSLGYTSGQLQQERIENFRFYMGEPFGNEVEGRSQVVMTDVYDTIEAMIPSFIRVFSSTDQLGVFEPVMPDDEDAAKQATDYINYLLLQKNDGFMNIYTAVKDALLYKNCVAKIWYDDYKEEIYEKWEELNQEEYLTIVNDGNIEVLKQEMTERDLGNGQTENVYSLRAKKTIPRCGLKWSILPPEEFLISRRSATIDDAEFICHRYPKPRGELIKEGYDKDMVYKLPAADDWYYNQEKIERFKLEDSSGLPRENMSTETENVTIFESYVHVDFDGDGYAERRRIVTCGQELLKNEEAENVFFVSGSCVPVPHKFFGVAPADTVKVFQLVNSQLVRIMLDNMYVLTQGRFSVIEGQVNFDDLLSVRAGGHVRVKNHQALAPITTPGLGQPVFDMLEYLKQEREQRVGVSRLTQGLQPDAINKTASGISNIMSASEQRLELMAKILAETFVKGIFKAAFKLVIKFEPRENIIRMKDTYVKVDPRTWNSDMDVSVNVGLGTNNKDKQLAGIQGIIGLQKDVLMAQGGGQPSADGPIVTMENVYNALNKYAECSGFKQTSMFFSDPSTPQMQQVVQQKQQQSQQQQPDPVMTGLQMEDDRKKEENALKAADNMRDHQLKVRQMELDHEYRMLSLQQAQQKIDLDEFTTGLETAQKTRKDINHEQQSKNEVAVQQIQPQEGQGQESPVQ